ncbi:peroxin [Komagataella kurtzmanii]|nr:peroxin [Komagataella kurtzmanii]
MLEYTTGLIRRNKKKFLISSGIIGVGYYVTKTINSKIQEFQNRIREENFAKEQIKRRFHQTQSDCYMTFLSLLPVLCEPIMDDLPVETITKQLQIRRLEKQIGNKDVKNSGSTVLSDDFSTSQEGAISEDTNKPPELKSKNQLWQELKIKAITRFLTLIYCESLLIVFLHLQLNILSRKSYLETAIRLASETQGIDLVDQESNGDFSGNTQDENLSEQAFLSFSWWLLNKGWLEIKNKIEPCVEQHFGGINPRQQLKINEFAELLNKCQNCIDLKVLNLTEEDIHLGVGVIEDQSQPVGRKSTNFITNALLPPKEFEFFLLQQTNDLDFLSRFNNNIVNTESLNMLLDELNNYLNNADINLIVNKLATLGITKVLDEIVLNLLQKNQPNPISDMNIRDIDLNDLPPYKLAALLANITKQSISLTNNSVENPTLADLNNLPELNDLSASVYSNFDP